MNTDYMSPDHLKYFKEKLLSWREELINASTVIMTGLREVELRGPDPVDYGSLQAEKERSLLAKRRNTQLIRQIEHALSRIQRGEYGYCEVTGEPIGLARLQILPLTTLCIEAQERLEREVD